MIIIVFIYLAFMIPAALVWVLAFLTARCSRAKRVALFFAIYLVGGAAIGFLPLLFVHVWLPGTLLSLALLEWAAGVESK